MTRFRGMISTQPGSTPEASFKIVSLEAIDPCVSYNAGNDFGTSYIISVSLLFDLFILVIFLFSFTFLFNNIFLIQFFSDLIFG